MGYNRRKIQADRKAKADAEASARRANDAQVLEGRRTADRRLQLAAGPPDATPVSPNDRRRTGCAALVLVGALPGLPHPSIHRPAQDRSTP